MILDLERVKDLISDKIVFTPKTAADKKSFDNIRKNEKLYRSVGTPTYRLLLHNGFHTPTDATDHIRKTKFFTQLLQA